MGETQEDTLPGGGLKVCSAEDAVLLWAVEPLKGCERPLLDSEASLLHIPVGRTGESKERVGLCGVPVGSHAHLLAMDSQGLHLSADIPASCLLTRKPCLQIATLKCPGEETATGSTFQPNRQKIDLKVTCLKLKGVTYKG